MRVLIADDNVLVRSGIAEILSDRGWEICGEASEGAEALEKARKLRPDLVLLDVSMPGVNGFEIAKVIRKELPDVRIVIVSQHDLDQLLGAAHKNLADGLVDKSRLGSDLIPTIGKLFLDA
jgi:two-component system, NarL family, response regulator NreC